MNLLKAIIYRFYSSVLTFLISFFLTGNLLASVSIGILDSTFKVFSYYLFELMWNKWTRYPKKPCVIWLTGLSGAGKTTIANALKERYNKQHIFPVILDGDEIRQAIKQDGFDEESRKNHNRNVGYIASLFERQGNIVIVALISPYSSTRNEIRNFCTNFVEVYVSTDLEVCKERDVKGLYKKALAGEIKEFTGISSPYEAPEKPEINIDTNLYSIEESVNEIMKYIKKL